MSTTGLPVNKFTILTNSEVFGIWRLPCGAFKDLDHIGVFKVFEMSGEAWQ